MPDPLTVLLDAIWIEARWQQDLLLRNFAFRSGLELKGYNEYHRDSIIGRNVFWVSIMEGERWSCTTSSD